MAKTLITATIDVATKEVIKRIAQKENRSVSQIINIALIDLIKRQTKK